MSAIEDYNPLKSIDLPGVSIDTPGGLVVVIGPNSSGKTLFLKDIENFLRGRNAAFVVCKEIVAGRPLSFDDYLKELEDRDLIRRPPGRGDQYFLYVPTLIDKLGQQQEIPSFNLDQIKTAWDKFDDKGRKNETFFNWLGIVLVSPLTLEMRREVCNSCDHFDWQTQRPTFSLQALSVDSKAKSVLAEETGGVFGNVAWLDNVSDAKKRFHLKISGTPNSPTVDEMTNPKEAHKYPLIQREGDGYKSYVGICLSLMLGMPLSR